MIKDKILYQGNWISIILRDDWYEFSSFLNSAGVVYVLVFRTDSIKSILGRFEICPAHGDTEPTLTSLTGGVNENQEPIDTAIQEVYEEAGYKIDREKLIDLGKVFLSKASDNIAHLFAVDVTHLPREEAPGDGSFGEEGSYCDWVDFDEVLFCKDPVICTLILRLRVLLDNN